MTQNIVSFYALNIGLGGYAYATIRYVHVWRYKFLDMMCLSILFTYLYYTFLLFYFNQMHIFMFSDHALNSHYYEKQGKVQNTYSLSRLPNGQMLNCWLSEKNKDL